MLSPYLLHILILFCIFATLALGFMVSVGSTGLINIGFMAFMALGGYASAIAAVRYHLPVWIGFLFAAGIAAGVAALLSVIVRKVKSEVLVVLTLAFHFAVFTLLINSKFTRGALGIPGIPRPAIFSDQAPYLALALILLAATYLFFRAMLRSPLGRVLGAVRDDEPASQVLGKDVARAKRITFIVTGATAGLAGALFAHYIQFVDPRSFHLDQIVLLLTIIIIGGLGSLEGALVGTALAVFLPEALRFLNIPPAILGPVREITFSVILILVLLYRPKGIMGKVMLK